MKRVLRLFLISFVALWLTAQVIKGFIYTGGFPTLVLAAAVFTIINLLVRPILRLFFLPLNLITLGLFSWIINVLALYLLVLVIPQIKISAFDFPGYGWQGFLIPAMHLNFFLTLVVSSFFISLTASFLNWLAK